MEGKQPEKPKLTRFARFSRRSRLFVVLFACIALICFVGLPLLYSGHILGPAVVQGEVFAATATQTPAPSPTPQAESLAAVSAPIATPTPQVTEDISLTFHEPTFQLEDDDPAISILQERLMSLGYFEYDVVTTYYGSMTKSAVELFQRTHGLEQTGIADQQTQHLLYSDEALTYHMKPGDNGTDVRSMQMRLNELGYFEDKENGYFGVATERAVKKFQERNKEESTGIIDLDGVALLYSHKARPLVDPTPTPKPSKSPKPSSTPKASSTPKPEKTKNPAQEIPEITPDPVWITQTPNTPVPEATQKPTSTPKPSQDIPVGQYGTGVEGLIAAANANLGKPYIYGDRGPDSFDCSGFVYYSLRLAGMSVGRYSALSYSQMDQWQAVNSLADCRRGDLLFYKSDKNPNVNHTGIYLGNGTFIHASSSAGKVIISNCTDYYQRNFVIARRVF